MNKVLSAICVFSFSFALMWIIWPGRAYAYIDAGSGSLILQALMAGLFGGFFTVKMYWKKIRQKIVLLRGEKTEQGAARPDDPPQGR